MSNLRICVIGAGNITNTRHIPAIRRTKGAQLAGAISDKEGNLTRTQKTYAQITNSLLLDRGRDLREQLAGCAWFMQGVDAVVIGTPPKDHFALTRACLQLGKHVLVEKPMMLDVEQCDEVMAIAQERGLVLNVMHSFQFATKLALMHERAAAGAYGEIQSVVEIQLSNRDRRLPVWYDDLPLGLFYDEAAHFFYTAMRIGGDLHDIVPHAQFCDNMNTPRHLEIQLRAGDLPVQMYMNFNSPVCEWTCMILGTQKIAIYDFFKDILIVADNDGQHLAANVLKTSLQYSWGFWKGFARSGFSMVTGRQLYGHDGAMAAFVRAVATGEGSPLISAESGRKVVAAMNAVVSGVQRA
jgi:predicted dehydrogenase